ncbi:hypothetical protein K504DRAFT_460301 [Pleomassaria siparia CBS 279.74]|uniref:Uncharacterized protein n=1 Tax=Pleomassaria siparia CBS 279.74 TaxID=1314801 RepID=A0A6G1JYA1_9PLEO|nr:hypothetical protein K504DRAFT_460301 [Pleomassaria siparia CBS 279.74]
MALRDNVVVESAPPSYVPGGYGTIEVREVHHHHHHNHILGAHAHQGSSSSCFRATVLLFLMAMLVASFAAICFVAWSFYRLSECEKNRMPWEKECENWLRGRTRLNYA